MKYDDAEYCFLNFETDLDNEAGGTHTGMFLAWAGLRGLLGFEFDDEVLAPLKAREVTGAQLYFDLCDGKLTDDDLSDVGNAFAASYYEAHFAADYQRVFAADMPNGGESTDDFCSVPDTWENFDRLAPVLDERFEHWRQSRLAPAAPAAAPTLARLAILEDPAEAVENLRARAAAGDDGAWFDLGVEYITGQRVPQDMTQAADAFTRGADRGAVECQFNLGVCFQNGDGRPKDPARALHWFGQAANGGHADGTFQLAMAYRLGEGVPQDLLAANALMLLAQARGSDDARKAGITAGTLMEATVLMSQLREPGQLLPTLARRRAAIPAGGASAARLANARSTSELATPTETEGGVGRAPVIALLVGAAGFILLLLATSFIQGTPLKVLALLLGAVAAFGAYRCSLGLGFSRAVSALLGVVAFVPVVGSFVCLALVLRIARKHRPG